LYKNFRLNECSIESVKEGTSGNFGTFCICSTEINMWLARFCLFLKMILSLWKLKIIDLKCNTKNSEKLQVMYNAYN